MIQDFHYKGFWWIPENPKIKFAGELTIDGTGTITLTVMVARSVFDYFQENEKKFDLMPVINGHAKDAATSKDIAITLFKNSIVSYQASEIAVITISCSLFTTLGNMKSLSDLRIGSLFLKLQLLNDWTSVKGIQTRTSKGKRTFGMSFTYKRPKPISLYTTKEFKIYIWFKGTSKSKPGTIQLTQSTHINIEFKKEVTIEYAKQIFELVRNFFSFCISLPVRAEEILFQHTPPKVHKKMDLEYQHTYELVFSDTRAYTQRASLQGEIMLIDYPTFSKKDSLLLKKWFLLNNDLQPVMRLYFDTLYNRDLYKENAFLNYSSAAEIYHRTKFPNSDGKDERYNKTLASIKSKITNNEMKWLETKLARRKDQKLSDRLFHLLTRTPSFSQRMSGNLSVEEFGDFIARTRNYYTHFSEQTLTGRVAEGAELLSLTHKMRILIQVQLLLDLGFEESEIDSLISKAISNWVVWQS